MTRQARLECREMRLHCLAPVHIGSGDKLSKSEYVFHPPSGRVYFLDDAQWLAFLNRRRLHDSLAQFLLQPYNRSGIWSWLEKAGVQEEELAGVSCGFVALKAEDRRELNDVAPFLRGADGVPYIPGSSLKGALRTGLLYGLLRQEEALRRKFWPLAAQALAQGRKGDAARLAQQLEQELLHRLQLVNGHGRPLAQHDALLSVLRGLQVGDLRFDAPHTVLQRKVDWSTHAGRLGSNEKKLPIYRECLAAGSSGTFRLTVDREFLAPVGLTGIDDVLAAVRACTQATLALQQEAFGPRTLPAIWREAQEGDVLLGGGTGFLSKTFVLWLAPDAAAAREVIAAYLDATFKQRGQAMHRHVALDQRIAPRTLKLAVGNGQSQLLGLCRLEAVPC